jgi:hypothetical protein
LAAWSTSFLTQHASFRSTAHPLFRLLLAARYTSTRTPPLLAVMLLDRSCSNRPAVHGRARPSRWEEGCRRQWWWLSAGLWALVRAAGQPGGLRIVVYWVHRTPIGGLRRSCRTEDTTHTHHQHTTTPSRLQRSCRTSDWRFRVPEPRGIGRDFVLSKLLQDLIRICIVIDQKVVLSMACNAE